MNAEGHPSMYRLRVFALLVVVSMLPSRAAAVHIWFSSSPANAALPATSSAVVNAQHTTASPGGSLYLWARPDAGQTLRNWSFVLHSTNPQVVTFTTSDVSTYNPILGVTPGAQPVAIRRWETVNEPSGGFPAGSPEGPMLQGFSIVNGFGIGPATTATDQYYNSANNAWLLGRVDYQLTGTIGQTSLFLQIGSNGISNAGMGSSQTSVIFGHQNDGLLNGLSQRYTSSNFADAVITVSAATQQNADFNSDGDIDGRDFLTWQRNFARPNAILSDGDANGDQTVNTADLAIWHQQYVHVPQTGDFDDDADVDGRDFLAWQRGFGQLNATRAQGDSNADHKVNSIDLSVWQHQFGGTPGLAAVVTIPEPDSLSLLIAFCGALVALMMRGH